MRIVFTANGLLAQFEGYDQLKEFDFAGYRARYGDIRRLDRLLEAEADSTNRYQVPKQADVLMLRYLLPDDELQDLLGGLGYHVTAEQLAQTADYYLSRTVDGSTLSSVVTSWVLARANPAEAWRCLQAALNTDVADIQGGTTAEGIHLGAMAGTVDIVLRCLTGLLARGSTLRFDPALPAEVRRLQFSIHYRGTRLDIGLAPGLMSVTCRPGPAAPVSVMVREDIRQLGPGETAEFRF
jgi:trehalose/maltose hydrolase-like predicted phosphorylase